MRTEQEFWGKVVKRDADGCWEWQGSRDNAGYGRVLCSQNKKWMRAHRVSWMLTNGLIPHGHFVCHHCDNPPCVRPDHLFVGTAKDNTEDAYRKGRLDVNLAHMHACSIVYPDDQVTWALRQLLRQGASATIVAGALGVPLKVVIAWLNSPSPRYAKIREEILTTWL